MNLNEYGNFIRINANRDISGNINTMKLISPSPVVNTQVLTVAEGLTVGAIPIVDGDETFQPNEYVEYKTKSGDIFISGQWEARLFSQDNSAEECRTNDDRLFFTVDP